MKIKTLSVLLTLFLAGCSDFLEERSQSEVHPSTVNEMEKILLGDAYCDELEGQLFNYATDVFTDNKKSQANVITNAEFAKDKQRWRFAWDPTMFDDGAGGEDVSFWFRPYEKIKCCNVVLDFVGEMTGDEVKREYLRGEALALRGYYYLYVVNFFAMPYNEVDPATTSAVPVKVTSGVTEEFPNRSMLSEVYKRIESDLLEGAKLMQENMFIKGLSLSRMNHLAAYAFTTRMYLYMEDWDNVIKYADLVLGEKPDLLDLKTAGQYSVYDQNTPVEILWMNNLIFKNNSDWMNMDYYSSLILPFTPSDELVNVYGADQENNTKDIRGNVTKDVTLATNAYLMRGRYIDMITRDTTEFIAGVDKAHYSKYGGGIRTAEVYLNRAEAYLAKYKETGDQAFGQAALTDLNELRRHRFMSGYVDAKLTDFTTADELIAFYQRERRRELASEGNHRWFDLRRTGMPHIEHVFNMTGGGTQTYILEEGDARYVLPIPAKVLEKNPNLRK